MIDAYQGYHQTPLANTYQDKVSFITVESTFRYTVMLFGLKNVGATYQQLMDKVFAEQLERNVEVYIHDILVKTLQGENLVFDLDETFATLWKYHMRLNLEKCIF